MDQDEFYFSFVPLDIGHEWVSVSPCSASRNNAEDCGVFRILCDLMNMFRDIAVGFRHYYLGVVA